MVNDSEHRQKPPPRQAASRLARIRAEIAANLAADDVIRRQMLAIERSMPDAWPPPPEWYALNRQRDTLSDIATELSKQLGAAIDRTLIRDPQYDCDAAEIEGADQRNPTRIAARKAKHIAARKARAGAKALKNLGFSV